MRKRKNKNTFFCYLLFRSICSGLSGHYRPCHTPNSAIICETHVMNLDDEPKTLVLVAPGALDH